MDECLTHDFAQRIIAMRADAQLQQRLEELAEKSTEGALTESERTEYEQYVEAIDFISILQSKARRFLAHRTAS